MDRRSFLKGAGAAAGSVWLGACSVRRGQGGIKAAPDPGGPSLRPAIRFGGADFGLPNPLQYIPPAYTLVSYIYDSLLWPDGNGTLHPWLAKSHERSPDGLTHRFKLRENVKWHDGKPFTASDVVFTFDYFRSKRDAVAPFVVYQPRNIANVAAEGAHAVSITLDQPLVTFERSLLAGLPILPEHIWSGIDDPRGLQDLKLLVGTGAYRLKAYSSAEGAYLFEANDDFFLGRPFVEEIQFTKVGDSLNALMAGAIDAGGMELTAATDLALKPFRADPRFGIIDGPADFPAALYWNLSKGGPLGDVAFRHACAHAIDRVDMASRLFGDQAKPGNPGFLPHGHPYRVDVEQYRFNRALANRMLDQAGYRRGPGGVRRGRDGKELRFKLVALPSLAPAVEIIQDALRAVGVVVEIDPVDPIEVFTSLSEARYEMAVLFTPGISEDPDFMRRVYSSRAETIFYKAAGYKDEVFDRLAEEQRVIFDEQQRKVPIAQMQRIVARDLPLLHLYYPVPFLIYRRSVFGQWSFKRGGGSPYNKQVMITGKRSGLDIRPIKGA